MSDNSSLKKKRNYPKDDITSLPGGVLLKIKGSSIPRTSSFCDALVRYLVALMGVFGICTLVVDALRFDVGIFDMLLPCAMFTAAFFVLFTSFKLAILGVFGLSGGTLLMAELAGVSVSKLFMGGVTLIIARISTIMDSLGYVSKSPTYYGYETVEGLLTVSAFITAFVFSLCIRKRSISFIVVAISGAIIIPSYFYGMLKSFGSAVCIICSLCGYHAIAVSEKHGNDRKQSGYSGILALVLAVAILISPIADINKPWAENSKFSSLYVYVEQLIKDLSNGKMPNLGWGTYIPSPNEKRTAKPSARVHIGSKIMDVYSSYNDTVYLRTWAGGKYSDDSWYPVVWNDVLENNPEINNKDAISHLARLIERPMLSDLIDVYEYTEYGEALWSLDIFEREIMVFPYEESNVLAIPSLFTGTDISVKSMIYDGVAVKSSSKNETYIARGYPISLLYNEKAVSVIDELVQGYVQCMKYSVMLELSCDKMLLTFLCTEGGCTSDCPVVSFTAA